MASRIIFVKDEVIAIWLDSPQAIFEEQNLKSNTTSTIKGIESIEVLEKLILKLIKKMVVETKREYVSVIKLKTLFQTQFKQPADATVKQFKPDSSLNQILTSPKGQASFAGIAPHIIQTCPSRQSIWSEASCIAPDDGIIWQHFPLHLVLWEEM